MRLSERGVRLRLNCKISKKPPYGKYPGCVIEYEISVDERMGAIIFSTIHRQLISLRLRLG